MNGSRNLPGHSAGLQVSFAHNKKYETLVKNKVENWDFRSSDIKRFENESWRGCLLQCAREGRCKAVTYKLETRQCWTKTGVGKRIEHRKKPGKKLLFFSSNI